MKNTLISNTTLFDGKFLYPEKTSVLFNEKGIIKIGQKIDEGFDIEIDGSDLFCLPGLMDCHVHLTMDGIADPFHQVLNDSKSDGAFRALHNAGKHIEAGVVTVRNVGAQKNIDIALRNAIDQGVVSGPRIVASGRPIVMTGGHGYPLAIEVDGRDEVRKAARTQLKAGADLLKLMATGGVMTPGVHPNSTQLSEDELRCACEEAIKAGKTTAAHAQGADGIKNAIRAGITTIEHGIYLDDEAIELMLEYGTYLVPTLVAPYFIVKYGLDAGIPKYAVEKAKEVVDIHKESFLKAYKAGVKIATGTDAGTPFNLHGAYVEELLLMVKNGMKEMDVLRSSTSISSKAMKIDDVTGTLTPGKNADLLLVRGNPLSNMDVMNQVEYVFKGGTCLFEKNDKNIRVI